MKTLFYLLLTATLFAQNNRPDTLILVGGRSYPCLITDIDKTKIDFIYSQGIKESSVLIAIKSIYLENHGQIYSSETGYAVDINNLNDFVRKRNVEFEKIRCIEHTGEKPLPITDGDEVLNLSSESYCEESFKKWSFGVIYVPYYSGKTYTLDYSSSYFYGYPYLTSYENNRSTMEMQLAYSVIPTFKFVFGCGYNSTFTERRYESQYTSYGSTSNDGSKVEIGLKLLDINVGLKYHLIEIYMSKATAFLLLGIGKQFAFADHKSENLFPQSSNSTIQDNAEDFIKSLHSPWHFTLGAGTEYFFNESLSVTANLRLVYSSVSGEYNYKYTSLSQTQTWKEKYSGSDLTTRVGVGLNFYF